MQQYITQCGLKLSYRLTRSQRRTIGFHVNAQGLEIRAPRRLRQPAIEAAIETKKHWIERQLKRLQSRQAWWATPEQVWCLGGQLPYLGQPVLLQAGEQQRLRFVPAPSATGTRAHQPPQTPPANLQSPSASLQTPQRLPAGVQTQQALQSPPARLLLPADTRCPEHIFAACKKWLQSRGRTYFKQRLDALAAPHGLTYKQLRLGWSKRHWGWCRSDGTIMLNWRLVHYPPALIDYIVAHELAHLMHMNHSPQFWQWVEIIYPEYHSAKEQLARYHPTCIPIFSAQES